MCTGSKIRLGKAVGHPAHLHWPKVWGQIRCNTFLLLFPHNITSLFSTALTQSPTGKQGGAFFEELEVLRQITASSFCPKVLMRKMVAYVTKGSLSGNNSISNHFSAVRDEILVYGVPSGWRVLGIECRTSCILNILSRIISP